MNEEGDIGVTADKLIAFLRRELKNDRLGYASDLTQIRGGYETAIYRFRLSGSGDELSDFLILRLYPLFYGSHNAIWESTVQNVLAKAGYPVAKAHFVCTDTAVLGGAFFIMDYLPGQPLMFAAQEIVPGILGKTHADLHKIDPKPVSRAFEEQGVDGYNLGLASRNEWFKYWATQLTWINESVAWLLDNRPAEPERLAICHGDFHALNILVKGEEVTGVVDWGGFAIADPAFDIANTIVLMTIAAKHLSASWEGLSSIDWDLATDLYLSEYQIHKELERTNLDYYKVRRCVMSLIQGYEGQEVWQQPLIVGDLVHCIQEITGIKILLPG